MTGTHPVERAAVWLAAVILIVGAGRLLWALVEVAS